MGLRRRTLLYLLIFTKYFGTSSSVSINECPVTLTERYKINDDTYRDNFDLETTAAGCSVGQSQRYEIQINDTHRGIIFDLEAPGVTGFQTPIYDQNIRYPPYVDLVLQDNQFVMSTNERFLEYEENEISLRIFITVTFTCSNNNNFFRIFDIYLRDTNNHRPRFLQPDHRYVLDAPTPPGYQVTGCLSDLITRDVDLTTYEIKFEIEDNPYFRITYSNETSIPQSKEFKAIVTTKTFIRNLPEEITLTITAEDVDCTGDPPLRTTGSITIVGNQNYVFPDEPVFSKNIYNGIYKTNSLTNEVVLDEPISLQQGYDDLVGFYIEGTYKNNFRLVPIPSEINQRTIEVTIALQEDVLLKGSIALEIIAEREFTSGASATVILQLPEVVPVQFESAHYEGTIENNALRLSPLVLSQGYEDTIVSASFVQNGYYSFFSAEVKDNKVEVSMTDLNQTVIDQNSFIYLQLVATARSSTATAVITLEIIKDDNFTPVFEKPIYTGSYDPATNLTIEQISFSQGYDGVDSLVFVGEHQKFFTAQQNGPYVTVEVSPPIPSDLFNLGRIELSLQATKPRTVGATATVIITLPAVVPVQFESAHYEGSIENNALRLSPLVLSQGYEDTIVSASFVQSGYYSFFSAEVKDNKVEVSMTDLNQTVIDQNSFIYLQLVATARSSTATAVITLEIIKDDNFTPVFEKPIYTGSYDPATNLTIEQISFSQGYDGVDSLVFVGEHQKFFTAQQNGPYVTVEVSPPIPSDLFNLGRIELSLQATKPRTVGATATVIITLPAVVPVQFESAHYEGTIENNALRLSPLVLSQGYEDTIVSASFVQSGYYSFFSAEVKDNKVEVSMTDLNQTVIDQNSFIYLQLVATARSSTATAVITLEIIKDDNFTPVFEKPIYTGSYDPATNLTIEQISFSQGYDGVNSLVFVGEHQKFFTAQQNGPYVTVEVSPPIPSDLFNLGRIELSLQATKPRTVGATAAVIITLPADQPPEDDASFEKVLYEGSVAGNDVQHENIKIFGFNETSIDLRGDNSEWFKADVMDGLVSVIARDPFNLPAGVSSVALELHARSARAVLLLKVSGSDQPPVDDVFFEKVLYEGFVAGNDVQHENIKIFGFNETSIDLRGDNSEWFKANVMDGLVSVIARDPFNLPAGVSSVALELHARSARAVLLLKVSGSDQPPGDDVFFEKVLYEGSVDGNDVQHENIKIFGFNETSIDLRGDNSEWFKADVMDGLVSVIARDPFNLPAGVSSVALELHARSARAVLLLKVSGSDQPPGDDVFFEKVLYEGSVDGNDVQHENIKIFGFNETSIDLRGDNSEWFKADVMDGLVSVIARDPFNLPAGVSSVALELHARSARAVLLLKVSGSDQPPEDDVFFEKVLYEGFVAGNDVQHENIKIFGFNETSIDLRGDNSEWFKANVMDGLVSVIARDPFNLPAGVSSVALELHARSARAVLLLKVSGSDQPPEDDVFFEKVLYEGSVAGNDVQHENIKIFGFNETSIDLRGDNSEWFKANVMDGLVSVIARDPFNLPAGISSVALELHARSARAVLLLKVSGSDQPPEDDVFFEKVLYEGSVAGNDVQHENIKIFGFNETSIDLRGDNSEWFQADVMDGLVSVIARDPFNLPAGVSSVALELHARSARAVLLLKVSGSDQPPEDDVFFEKVLYEGFVAGNDVQHENIKIFGFNETSIDLRGDNSEWFKADVMDGLVSVIARDPFNLPAGVSSVALELHARSARAVLLLKVSGSDQPPEDDVFFEKVLYEGFVAGNDVQHENIKIFGFNETSIDLRGDNSEWFKADVMDGLVSVIARDPFNLPAGVSSVALELHARSARAVLLLKASGSDQPPEDDVFFEKVLYEGSVAGNDVQHENIKIFGFNETSIDLRGDNSEWFKADVMDGLVSVIARDPFNLPAGVSSVALELHARSARAVLLLKASGSDQPPEDDVFFEKVLYEGFVAGNDVQHENIKIFGFNETSIDLRGDNSEWFKANVMDGLVSVIARDPFNLPAGVSSVALELHARSARAVLLLKVSGSDQPPEDDVFFEKVLYEGSVAGNDVQHENIKIFGFNETSIDLRGDNSEWFKANVMDGLVSVIARDPFNLPAGVSSVALELHARSARAVLLLKVSGSDQPPEDDVFFEKVLYEGSVAGNDVQHENIKIFGFNETSIDLRGDNSEWFKAEVMSGLVSVTAREPFNLPPGVSRVALELQARSARAVLLLNVLGSGSEDPSVEFSSESYALSVSTTQTGVVGRVSATVNNGEAITYSLNTDNAHLQSRLSINNEGELHLSAPADSGVYTFQVVAATVISQAKATATVHLIVEAAMVCDDSIVVPPLVVIDRDEEEEHRNLVVLDPTQHAGCRYTMTSRWPTQQSWLYVDDTGLHTRAIDREHESIAFMTVSQVQVELILQCDNDPVQTKRSKRSYDWLDPYDYGSNKWTLTDSIPYNSRRTLVNLIVNDINDNAPIFVGKENEPIAVGYPNSELEERILPRSLAELQATDADIGINAALRYSSLESVLAVAPTTGFVHVRSGASLQHDQILTVIATDQNGEGLSGSIQLVVKLLDLNHIAVVTVRDVFLDDEKTVLNRFSDALGYEVKALKSVVVSDDNTLNGDVTNRKRETSARTSLQLYVYGLVEQEPVLVSQLTSDLNGQSVIQNVATIPLETHLENENVVYQTAVGLLVATIILSVLLFVALGVIGVYFFLKWKKNRLYNEFSDDSSLAARNDSLIEEMKPEEVRPRLNIEELKRSEKRLQERLATPMEEVTIEPMPRKVEPPVEAILAAPVPELSVPIVIQSIDKLKDADNDSDTDEFGEANKARRKSVVTFNENVEKIIHVQDDVDESDGYGTANDVAGNTGTSDTTQLGFEVYRL